MDGRWTDLPAGALEPPTNRTELGLLQEEGQGMPCSFPGLASTYQGPAPCSACLVFSQSPPALILSLPACGMGTMATAVS